MFLAWLAGIIDDEFAIGLRRARSLAWAVAASANTRAAIWGATGASRAQIESTAPAFAFGGLRSAIAQHGSIDGSAVGGSAAGVKRA